MPSASNRARALALAVLPIVAVLVAACGDASAPGSGRLQQEVAVPSQEPAEPRVEPRRAPPPPPPASATPDAGADAGYRDPVAQDAGCAAPNQVCGGRCVSTTNEVGHCGGCGRACVGGGAVCVASNCACSQPGFQYCAATGGCTDVTTDDANCGACGNACTAGLQTCQNGTCVGL